MKHIAEIKLLHEHSACSPPDLAFSISFFSGARSLPGLGPSRGTRFLGSRSVLNRVSEVRLFIRALPLWTLDELTWWTICVSIFSCIKWGMRILNPCLSRFFCCCLFVCFAGISLCCPGWSAVVGSQLTATSVSWFKLILLSCWYYRHVPPCMATFLYF